MSENKYPTYSQDEYTGNTNEEAKKIRKQISEIKQSTKHKIESLEKELSVIYDNCIHEYKVTGDIIAAQNVGMKKIHIIKYGLYEKRTICCL